MKLASTICHTLVLVAMAGAFSLAARADSVFDPTVIIRDPTCPKSGCPSVGTHFSFGTPAGGVGALFFTNGSSVNFFNLLLTESGVPSNAVTCITDAFKNCQISASNGITSILLSGVGGNFAGIPAGRVFDIEFKCKGSSCWPGDLDFSAVANVPEPTTMALMATGIGALFSRRKRWKHAA